MQYEDVTTNPRWRTDAILKIVFGYIFAPYWIIRLRWNLVCRYAVWFEVTWV